MGEKVVYEKPWKIFGKEVMDREVMAQIMEFDRKLVKSRDGMAVIERLAEYGIEALGMCMVLVSYVEGVGETDVFSIFISIIWLTLGLSIRFGVYTIIVENNKRVSIYKILNYLPVNIWDVFKVRLYYLRKLLFHRLVVLWVLQLPVIAYTGEIRLENTLYSLVIMILTGIWVGISVMPVGRNING